MTGSLMFETGHFVEKRKVNNKIGTLIHFPLEKKNLSKILEGETFF